MLVLIRNYYGHFLGMADHARELEALERILSDDAGAEPTRLAYGLMKSITNDFSPSREIGSGGFGVVYLVWFVLFLPICKC